MRKRFAASGSDSITRRSASARPAKVQRGLDSHDVGRVDLVPPPFALAGNAALCGELPDLVVTRRTVAMDTPQFLASFNEAQRGHSFYPQVAVRADAMS
jgi:hypothetical protein